MLQFFHVSLTLSLAWSAKRILEDVGKRVGAYPIVTITAAVAAAMLVSYAGLPRLHLLQDPVQLWTPTHSVSFRDMQRHQATFGPAFRVQQVCFFYAEFFHFRGSFLASFYRQFPLNFSLSLLINVHLGCY
jgi:hypothetical protein